MDTDMRGYHEKIIAFEQQILQARGHLKELESRGGPIGQQKDRELAHLTTILAETRTHTNRVQLDIKQREAEILKLRAQLDQSLHVHRTIQTKDEEIRELLKAQFEMQRKYEDHKHTMSEKNSELGNLEAEVRMSKQRYLNAKKTNTFLMKKIIVLSRDSREADQQAREEVESDEEVSTIRIALQDRVKDLKQLFSDQQFYMEQVQGLGPTTTTTAAANKPAAATTATTSTKPA